jgi:hypothetical protein
VKLIFPSARISRKVTVWNQIIIKIIGEGGKLDILDIMKKETITLVQWRTTNDRILPEIIMNWAPMEKRWNGRPNVSWHEGTEAAMRTKLYNGCTEKTDGVWVLRPSVNTNALHYRQRHTDGEWKYELSRWMHDVGNFYLMNNAFATANVSNTVELNLFCTIPIISIWYVLYYPICSLIFQVAFPREV